MEHYKNVKPESRKRTLARFLVLSVIALSCISCGPQVIKGRPPFISISEMHQVENRLSVEFDVRNQNGVPMNIDMVDIMVTVNGAELARENRSFELLIGANSSEHVRVEELPNEFRRSLLDSLEDGEVKSLPFDLKGRIHTIEDGYLSFAHKGFLYPVPGKPGHFRAAVTQAEGLQREEKF